ncbi:FIG01075668: hypothetical protein [hydrothermal vent metagenome]|uniref:Virulence factor domain-containing protein n=1 Tax=hydrothermal vent metagenome TaxID=652676 RepID=A0A3B0RY58_9ZZZZ
MAQLTITYWRDIPSQVSIGKGRKAAKAMLSDRFQEAIDMAAMRSGAAETDDYIAEWRREAGQEVDSDHDVVVAATIKKLESEYDKDKLKALIDNNGKAV